MREALITKLFDLLEAKSATFRSLLGDVWSQGYIAGFDAGYECQDQDFFSDMEEDM